MYTKPRNGVIRHDNVIKDLNSEPKKSEDKFKDPEKYQKRYSPFSQTANFGGGGGGGKALTMTMTPWNLPHGQWSKKLTMTMTPSILPMVNGQIDQF